MRPLITFGVLMIIAIIAGLACSANSGIDTPISPDIVETPQGDSTAWGAYNINVDPVNNEVIVTEDRAANPHYNVTNFILPPLCPDCVTGTLMGWDPATRILTLNITLTNSTTLTAYDVRGILILADPVKHSVANPDGYTKRFDNSTPKDINPFIYWRTGGPGWQFPGAASLTQEVQIVMPTPMNFNITFVVEACFPGHTKDPLEFQNLTLTGNFHDTGWLADLSVEVSDWQNDVLEVYADLSTLAAGNGEYALTQDIDGFWKTRLEYDPQAGDVLPALGDGKILLRAVDTNSSWNLYDYVDVTVTPDTDPPVWPTAVGITDVAIGAGRAVIYHDIAEDPSKDIEYYLYYSESADPFAGSYVTVTGAAHYTVTGLTNGIDHVFGVRAGDQAGNVETNVNYRNGTPQVLQLLWAQTVAAEINSHPNAADIDGDNDLDVVFGCDDGRVVAVDGTDGSIHWNVQTGGSVTSSPALVDINYDALADVVVGSGDGKLYGIRGTNGTTLGTYQTQNIIQAAPVILDFDNNGTPEVFFGSTDNTAYGLTITTMTLFANFNSGAPIYSTPCLAYLNADEYLDVIVCSGGTVYAVNGTNATALWSFDLGVSAITGSPAVAEVNGDYISDVIVGTSNGVYALDGTDGTVIWSNTTLGVDLDTSPALGDLNGDGVGDAVFSGKVTGIYAFDGVTGNLLWQAEGNPVVPAAPAIADVTGDGKLDVIAGSADLSLRIYNGDDGLILAQYNTGLAGAVTTAPVIADVNKDGFVDIVFGTEQRTIIAITTNQVMPSDVTLLPWPRFHRNQFNQGNLGASLVPQW